MTMKIRSRSPNLISSSSCHNVISMQIRLKSADWFMRHRAHKKVSSTPMGSTPKTMSPSPSVGWHWTCMVTLTNKITCKQTRVILFHCWKKMILSALKNAILGWWLWQSVWVDTHLMQISVFKMQIAAIEISAFKCWYLYLNIDIAI